MGSEDIICFLRVEETAFWDLRIMDTLGTSILSIVVASLEVEMYGQYIGRG